MKYLRDAIIIVVGGLVLLWLLGTAGILDRAQPEVIEEDIEEEQDTQEISLYYYSPDLDLDEDGNILCSRNGLVEIKRLAPKTDTPMRDSIQLLLQGDLTVEERAQGITTEFPLPSFELGGISNINGDVIVEFKDPLNKTSGGACRASVLWYQIERTILQFPDIQSVRFQPETLFQP